MVAKSLRLAFFAGLCRPSECTRSSNRLSSSLASATLNLLYHKFQTPPSSCPRDIFPVGNVSDPPCQPSQRPVSISDKRGADCPFPWLATSRMVDFRPTPSTLTKPRSLRNLKQVMANRNVPPPPANARSVPPAPIVTRTLRPVREQRRELKEPMEDQTTDMFTAPASLRVSTLLSQPSSQLTRNSTWSRSASMLSGLHEQVCSQ